MQRLSIVETLLMFGFNGLGLKYVHGLFAIGLERAAVCTRVQYLGEKVPHAYFP